MNKSESIKELSAALAKAQGVMEGATKDAANPFFKSKYADLSSVWAACRKALSSNGLSIIQTSDFLPELPDMVCIDTTLCHSSGEWISGRMVVKPVKTDPQAVGSCITYLRRYSLQSMVGIAPEDDDGNSASGKGKEAGGFVTNEQVGTIVDFINEKKVDAAKFLQYMGCESVETIPAIDFNKAIASLKAAKGKGV
jgi:hypothetical protein